MPQGQPVTSRVKFLRLELGNYGGQGHPDRLFQTRRRYGENQLLPPMPNR